MARSAMIQKAISLLTVYVLAFGCLSGCGQETAGGKTLAEEKAPTEERTWAEESISADASQPELAGSIRMVGSTSMEKLANALAESFMEKHQNVNVTVEFVGSAAGIQAVLSESADIGNSSRHLKEEEKDKGAVENIVAIDGIAICVDPANRVRGLTKRQLTDIYTGAVTNWSQVGGEDFPIVVIGHEAGSGTREAFEELLAAEDSCVYANELASSGAVLARIASTPGAIGYVSLDVADESVIALALDNVEPTAENIKAGNYFLSRSFVMVTKGEIDEQSELIRAWFDYVLGEEGRAVTARVGLIITD